MNFKSFCLEKFNFESKPSSSISWSQIGGEGEQSWRTSFIYDLNSHQILPHDLTKPTSKDQDVYYVYGSLILDPQNPTSSMYSLSKAKKGIIKKEPYWWVDFESKTHGTETISSGDSKPRRALSIFNKVISLLVDKIDAESNICFTAGKTQLTKVSLYTTLAELIARKMGKTFNKVTYQSEVYFLIH